MIKIEYAGLKPMISQHGISFKDGKEDKYKYLKYAIDILVSIDHPHISKQKYSHVLNDKRLSPNEIVDILKKHHPNLEETLDKEVSSYLKHLDNEENDVLNSTLEDIDKEVFINNLKIMRDYKIQRAKNKIFYFHCIQTIAEIIVENKIKKIETPFNERFWHILQTLEGELSKDKISSTLELDNSNDTTKAVLNVAIY